MVQQYYNPKGPDNTEEKLTEKPIEVTFRFPKEATSVVSKMSVTVGEKTVEAKVMEKKEAKQKYDDAVAGGKFAAMLQEDAHNPEFHQIDVGNILAG